MIPFLICSLLLPAQISVDPSKILNRISEDMYGSCIEDVNHEIYGGLYGQRIFGENFEEPGDIVGPAGWRALGGQWTSTGEVALCPAGDGPLLVLRGNEFFDGTVEARVRIGKDQNGSAGLIVRLNNPSTGIDNFDGYEIAFQAKAGTLSLSRHRHDYQPLAQVPAPIATGETHLIRALLKGPRIQVFLDHESSPRLDFTDEDHPILSGTIALRPWQADCSYQGAKIDGNPISLALQDGGLSGMWDPIGHPSFSLSREAFNGAQCQKITNPGGSRPVGIANRGLNRWGIAVRRGQNMEGRIALRGDVGLATFALQNADGSRTYARQAMTVSKDWRSSPIHLQSSVSDPNARFAVLVDRPGTLFVDQAELFDADRFHGLPVRGDIARAMVREKLTFLRYGGTMVNVPDYRWKNMIGPRDHRPPYRGNWYPYSTNGFGIFDFLNFCEAAHFRSAFAINIEETAQDAADLADYLTAPVTNEWGALRAADGHPAPYHPEYIEVGNEEGISGSPQVEMPHYAERFRLLEQAIHRRNPNLKLVCAAWWIQGSPEMKTVFDVIDGKAAAWDIHVGSDNPNSGIAVDRELTDIERSFKDWNSKSNLKVVVFEENGGLHNMQRALGHATTLNATRRHGNFVLADCPANCLQPSNENDNGWDQGQIFFTPDQVWGMPPYYAQQLLSKDRQPLLVSSTAPTELDVVASRSAAGNFVTLTVVNIASHPVPATVSLNNFQIRSASAYSLSGDLDATNSPSQPEKVSTAGLPLTLHQNRIELTLPAHSIVSLRVESR